MIFAPFGTSLAAHTLVPLLTVPAAWLFPSASPVTLYNASILLSVFLNFLCAYLAAKTLTHDRLASTFAAIAFGGAPFLVVRAIGHLNVLSAWGLPLLDQEMRQFLKRLRALAEGIQSSAAGADEGVSATKRFINSEECGVSCFLRLNILAGGLAQLLR